MRCPFPVTIRNPRADASCIALSDGSLIAPGGELLTPTIQVPCGCCVVCQDARRDMWATRMEMESRKSAITYFVTLTYNDTFYPGQLVVADVQKFIKRLRRRVCLRHFTCGEYGDRHGRGHYHSVIWLSECISLPEFTRMVQDSWTFGFTDVSEANRERFRYVAKYTVKSVRAQVDPSLQPPFAIMSRRPGISFDYFNDIKDFEHEYILLENGGRQALPRYNLEKLDPIEQVAIKRHRREFAETLPQMSDTEKQLRAVNLARRLTRKYVRKYGT